MNEYRRVKEQGVCLARFRGSKMRSLIESAIEFV
jgi:hypothetical protein